VPNQMFEEIGDSAVKEAGREIAGGSTMRARAREVRKDGLTG